MGTGRRPFIRLPGRNRDLQPARRAGADLCLFLHGRGSYAFDMIGAARFEDDLRAIALATVGRGDRKACTASLVCREGTPLERNTVAVEIAGRMVGYCPSYLAAHYQEWLEKWNFAAARVQCNAVIVGRWNDAEGTLSAPRVKLDVELPFKATTL